MWNVEVAKDADAKRGLAPVHRPIDRNPPYKRIATEEAWNIPEVLEVRAV